MLFSPEELSPEHDVTHFTSGKEDLDSWLKASAVRARRSNTAATFVWKDNDKDTVAGYYSLSAMNLKREELPTAKAKGNMEIIPAALLARLALDQGYQGQGLGQYLLLDALRTAVAGNRAFAVRFFVVDAIDEQAHSFYEKRGFVPFPHGSMRLFRKMSDIEATVSPLES